MVRLHSRFVGSVLAMALLAAATTTVLRSERAPQSSESSSDETVYVTNTGVRYHRDGCKWLYRSRRPMTLRQAEEAGYTPCKVCIGVRYQLDTTYKNKKPKMH
ncbi:MAG: hypothetical protein N3B17_00645 [Chlorobi bacterium]|nr:hypothetical protein [Chlorobiota bacterium]